MNTADVLAGRLTEECIRTAFQSSGKQRLIRTGGEEDEGSFPTCPGEDSFLVDLDDPFGKFGCVIMASGMGKRFGGNKLMARFRGKPMIQWALEATEGIFFRRVVVTRHETVRHLCEDMGVQVVLHDLPLRSDTIRLGLNAVGENMEGCLFCPGDQPLLRRQTVAAMALCAKNDSAIWRIASGETVGSPVLFPARCFPALKTLPAGKGGGYVIRSGGEPVKTVQAGPEELLDIDTRETLARLERLEPPTY